MRFRISAILGALLFALLCTASRSSAAEETPLARAGANHEQDANRIRLRRIPVERTARRRRGAPAYDRWT